MNTIQKLQEEPHILTGNETVPSDDRPTTVYRNH